MFYGVLGSPIVWFESRGSYSGCIGELGGEV